MHGKLPAFIGIALFAGVVTFPFWIGGERKPMPPPVIEAGLTQCVESAAFMRANHMLLLDQWRDSVVRHNDHVYVNRAGQRFEKSLTGTCLGCHSNKAEFCDRCHDAVAVKPYCWNCHLAPGQPAGPAATAAALPPPSSPFAVTAIPRRGE